MERYVDGFVIPIPNERVDAYREMAREAGKLWIEYGALEYFEGIGDDMEPDTGGMPMTIFPELSQTEDFEMVVFSFIVFESREHRDEVNGKVMEDSSMDPENFEEEMPSTQGVWRTAASDPASATKSDKRDKQWNLGASQEICEIVIIFRTLSSECLRLAVRRQLDRRPGEDPARGRLDHQRGGLRQRLDSARRRPGASQRSNEPGTASPRSS